MLRFGYLLLVGLACKVVESDDPEKQEEEQSTETEEETSVDTGDEDVEPSLCESLELSSVDFSEGPYGNDYGSIVEDFTVETLEGSWNFFENWSGCETYHFVNHHGDYDYPVQIWESDPSDLLASSPPNAHYFFMSYELFFD